MLPPLTAYQEAVQHPLSAFRDPELKLALPELDGLGLPKPRSGSMAVVFRLQGQGKVWAVRCFQRLARDQGERYAAISHYLQERQLPYFVPFDFLERGILVEGRWQPIVKMAWAEGEPLDRYVRRQLADRKRLEELADRWLRMLGDLELHRVAHGDLQHGNVLVDGGRLTLIDYDGMFVPSLAGRPSLELGHPNYQHPGRSPGDYGPWLDRFSGRAVHLALAALALRPELWREHSGGEECLLLRRSDFLDPGAAVWTQIMDLGAPGVSRLARQLQDALAEAPSAVPRLGQNLRIAGILAQGRPSAGRERRRAAAPPAAASRLPAWVRELREYEAAAGVGVRGLAPDVQAATPRASRPALDLRPRPLDRLLLPLWGAGLLACGALAPRYGALAAGVVAAWTLWCGGALALNYCLRREVREAGRLRRLGASARRKAARARAMLSRAELNLKTLRDGSARTLARIADEREKLGRATRARRQVLRREYGLDAFPAGRRELREQALLGRAQRLQDLRQQAIRRELESHRVADDPSLDVRRTARLALMAAGVTTAWDLVAVRDRLVVTRGGRRRYAEALGPERAQRIEAWLKAAQRQALAAAPNRLPPDEERLLDESLAAALHDLRLRWRAAERRFMTRAGRLRRDARRRRRDLDLQADAQRRACLAEEEPLKALIDGLQAEIEGEQSRESGIRQELDGYDGVRFGLYLRELLPRVGRRLR